MINGARKVFTRKNVYVRSIANSEKILLDRIEQISPKNNTVTLFSDIRLLELEVRLK